VSSSNGTAGVQFAFSTAGYENIQLNFSHRASGTASRWVRIDYSLDAGVTWVNNFWNNSGGLTPHDTYYNFAVNFSSISAANDNPSFRIRIVSIFSPNSFCQNNTTSYPANTAYQRANSGSLASGCTATGDYGTAGTWRFDNVTFSGTPIVAPTFNPFQLCNLIVYRVGDGNTALSNAATNVNLLEIGSSGSVVQTINNFTGANLRPKQ
jgi:hypothetical protein